MSDRLRALLQDVPVPTEPTPSVWTFPDPAVAERHEDFIGIGADLEPGTLLNAYRAGLFPMPLSEDLGELPDDVARIGWWSPDPRGILPLDGLRVSRSLRRSFGRFSVTVDAAFAEVIGACADTKRPHGWIDHEFIEAYTELHRLGWAHSVEVWSKEDGTLAGGLYGVGIGGLFAGESKFHRITDASKVAVVALVELLREHGYVLLDTQWATAHLETLGVVPVPRPLYLEQLAAAVETTCQSLGALGDIRSFDGRA